MATPLKYAMPIKTKGHYPALFCVHGEPLKIAMKLQAGRPVYGVNYSYYRFKRSEMPQTIEEYAALYLADIRAIQPTGPYYLCGYSVGGMIAYEIVRQLEAAGEEIGHLTLVEPTVPNANVTKLDIVKNRLTHFDSKGAMFTYYAVRFPILAWKRLQQTVRRFITRSYLKFDLHLPQNLTMSGLLMAIRPATFKFEYKPMSAGASFIYTNLDEVSLKVCREYWDERLAGESEFCIIGDVRKHLDLMEEPALGETLAILDKSVQIQPD
jgi:thioesterase domain-containing protein